MNELLESPLAVHPLSAGAVEANKYFYDPFFFIFKGHERIIRET